MSCNQNRIQDFPIKKNKPSREHRFCQMFIVAQDRRIYVQKRQKGIWANLYTLPLSPFADDIKPFDMVHDFTHFRLHVQLVHFDIDQINLSHLQDQTPLTSIPIDQRHSYPLSRLTQKIINML